MRERETFDVVAQVPSNHFVQQFGRAPDNRRLECITWIRPDSGLTKADENGSLREDWGRHLMIGELLRRIVFLRHFQELHDAGVL